MISAPLVAKSVVGVGALGSVSTGGYYYREEIKEYWYSQYKTFLVEVKEKSDNFLSSNRCFSSNTGTEKANCELRKVKELTKGFVSFSDLNNSSNWSKTSEQKEGSNLIAGEIYKLKIDITRFNKTIAHDNTDVFIKSKKNDTEFAKFKIIATLNKKQEETVGRNFFGIYKVKTDAVASVSETITDGGKCKFNEEKTVKCNFYKLGTDINFSTTPTKVTDAQIADGDKSNYFLIDLSVVENADKGKISDVDLLKTVIFFNNDQSDTTKQTTFTLEKLLEGKFNSSGADSEMYELKNFQPKTKDSSVKK